MIGRSLAHYRIVERIGAGGMGVVYRARDLHLERDVALKVLPAGALADDTTRRRFRREALALSRLSHPHIATVHDFDTEDGVDFLVMELVPGVPLDERIARGPAPEAEVRALGVQIAGALATAHGQGIVHRDLKPSNVVVSDDGVVKVLDFGLAALVHGREDEAVTRSLSLTATGVTLGTVPYMAPEQLLGQPVDGRTDVFALGVVLHELAAGRSPYRETLSTALVDEIVHQPPPGLRAAGAAVSPALESLVLRCLAKDPSHRFASARDVMRALEGERVAPPRPRRRTVVAGAAALLALGTAAALMVPGFRARLVGRHDEDLSRLAVLPLENLSHDTSQDYFAEGMTDELITRLSAVGALRVIARSSVVQYRGRPLDPAEVGRRLGVAALVTGSVLRAGDRARISAQLVRVSDRQTLWAESFDGDLRDVLTLQSRIAGAIADRIRVRLSSHERRALTTASPVDPEAHELYLRGRYYWYRYADPNAGEKAIACFKQAIEKDPAYAPAYVGLGEVYYDLSDLYLAPRQAMPLSRGASERAIQLDESLAEAHASLGVVKMVYDWDFPGAERELRRALELDPNNAVAHMRLGQYFIYTSRPELARAELQRATELDPLSPSMRVTATWPDYYAPPGHRHPARLIEQLRGYLTVDSTFGPAHSVLGLARLEAGDAQGALRELGEGNSMQTHPFVLAHRGAALVRAGRRRDAEETFDTLMRRLRNEAFVTPVAPAVVAAALGRTDEAFRLLDQAVEVRSEWLVLLEGDPMFDPLRSDPRFAALERRLGLGRSGGADSVAAHRAFGAIGRPREQPYDAVAASSPCIARMP